MGKRESSGAALPALASQVGSSVTLGRPLPALCLSLLICKMGVILLLPGRFVMKRELIYTKLRLVPGE